MWVICPQFECNLNNFLLKCPTPCLRTTDYPAMCKTVTGKVGSDGESQSGRIRKWCNRRTWVYPWELKQCPIHVSICAPHGTQNKDLVLHNCIAKVCQTFSFINLHLSTLPQSQIRGADSSCIKKVSKEFSCMNWKEALDFFFL